MHVKKDSGSIYYPLPAPSAGGWLFRHNNEQRRNAQQRRNA
ncbi:hypothetical protein SDC9_133182 [bioreactor metagenome]|uniref:Uncharacterized protein n=1 Tax=bioreactor metagenome TaxID=1076179 RepID=A0A645DA78_9ZZZZ